MRRPVNYDALRQAEQQARDGGGAPPQSEAAAPLDSAQPEPTRPLSHPGREARYNDGGAPEDVRHGQVASPSKESETDWAKQIAEAGKEWEAAASQALQQDKGKGGNER